jgi:hypothetical protein
MVPSAAIFTDIGQYPRKDNPPFSKIASDPSAIQIK